MNAPEPQPPAEHAAPPWTASRLALFVLTALALYLCWLIVRPFVPALAWASALAVIAWPLHRRLARRIRRPGLAALASSLGVVLLLGLPSAAMAPRIARETATGLGTIRNWLRDGPAQAMLEDQRWLTPVLDWARRHIDTAALLERAGDLAAGFGASLARASVEGLLQFALTFFLLFFFLRDRHQILARIVELLPMARGDARRLLHEVGDTLHATLVGKVLVSALQGVLLGLGFAFVGLPAPWFWAVVTAVVALVPLLGTPLIWGPAALWLLVDGQWGLAVLLALWGGLVVGLADNLLYPMLVGNRVNLHVVPMLLSMIGGLFVFGVAGFFIGPVVLAATLALLRLWSGRGEDRP